jgi:D-psicose/D-tagatose/L-ribulose 3-epimerase
LKLGVSAFAWAASFDQSRFELLPALHEQGFDGFEIPMFDPADIRTADLRRAMEANDLECTVCSILPPGINPISEDAAVRSKSQAHLVICVETCAELGANIMGGPVFAPIGYLPGRRRSQDEWNWAVECFQSLGSVLEANRVTLAIEPVNRSETFFLTTVAEAKALCDAIAHPRIGVLIDTFHANIEEKSIPHAVASLGSRLKHIHASENDRGVPGTGHVDFAGILQALREIQYDGYLMIEGLGSLPPSAVPAVEMWRRPDESPEAIAYEGAKFLRTLMAASADDGVSCEPADLQYPPGSRRRIPTL